MATESRGRSAPTPPMPYPGVVDNTEYVYWWNEPKNTRINDNDNAPRGIEYLTPYGTRKWLSLSELVETDEPPSRCDSLRRRLAALPHFVRRYYSQKLERLDQQGPKDAAAWLVNTFERHVLRRIDAVNEMYTPQGVLPAALLPLRDQFWRLLWAGKRELKRLAHSLADVMTGEFMRECDHQLAHTGDPEFAAISGYGRVGFLASYLNIGVPGWAAYCNEDLTAEAALSAVARLEAPRWWLNRLRLIHARWREHLMIAAGYVHKKAAPYCSNPCLSEWLAQKKANREFLKAMELEDQDTGERTSLIDKVAGSVANPANRRRELMARMRGFEDLAKAEEMAGEFYTLTAPSRFHSTQKDGRRNDKYKGNSPRDTQRYLCNVWARVRAEWKRQGIRVFGFRVVEPHHDGTPHWHLLLFMRPENVDSARAIFRAYALEDSGEEPGAAENRFKVVPIEEEHGSATGYIAKYISKNIDGYALDDAVDDETGEPLKDMARRVSAWASRWAIRQFQQIGGAPVTVWRELRKLGDRELVLHPEIEEARAAADGGEWGAYVAAQGGPLVERRRLRVRLSYEVTENGNDYGDDVSKISGIYCPYVGKDSTIFTRTAQYKIVPKRPQAGPLGGGAAPRSSVNNCTRSPAAEEKRPLRDGIATYDDASCCQNFGTLTNAEKKALSRRLSEEAEEDEQRKREVRRNRVRPQQEGEAAARLRDFTHSIGWEISESEIGLLLAGQHISINGQFYGARSDGALYRTREKPRLSTMTTVNTWLARLGADYRYRPDDAGNHG